MTVVSAMKFNEEEGAIVADEQTSTAARKFDIGEKIHTIEQEGKVVLYGGAGASDILQAVHKRTQFNVEKMNLSTCFDIASLMGKIVANTKNSYIDGHLKANYGIGFDDLRRGYSVDEHGKLEIDPAVKQAAWDSVQKQSIAELVYFGFLVLTKDAAGVGVYRLASDNEMPFASARPFDCIGSGRDVAERELSAFYANLPRDSRHSIGPVEGVCQLLYATDMASRINIGVGGTPAIAVIKEGKIVKPCENSSRLAGEIVYGARKGLLPEGFMHDAVDNLVFKGAKFSDVNSEMLNAAKDREALVLVLRGYKV
ncbi:hypothetical protein KY363_05995 [Candidatus Woesearchaeota archaeon]|nr:hypothetical protein [Candidatus Woesearchaeota archaeon]